MQIAEATESISDPGGILPRQPDTNDAGAPSGVGNVREYSPEEAAKLPPPSGSKYVTLNDGSVLWSTYSNHEKGGPMLVPKDVSLADNVKVGQKISEDYNAEAVIDPAEAWKNSTESMKRLFALVMDPIDYPVCLRLECPLQQRPCRFHQLQLRSCRGGSRLFQDYGLGLFRRCQCESNIDDRWRGSTDPSRDTSGPFWNKVRNAEMIERGYDDYKAGRIVLPSK